jgi:hypothetical protein
LNFQIFLNHSLIGAHKISSFSNSSDIFDIWVSSSFMLNHVEYTLSDWVWAALFVIDLQQWNLD